MNPPNSPPRYATALVTQVVFDKVVPRVVTRPDTILPPVVVNWDGRRRGEVKMYRTLLTRRLLNTNYQFHISLLLALRNDPRHPLDRQSNGPRNGPWRGVEESFSGPLH